MKINAKMEFEKEFRIPDGTDERFVHGCFVKLFHQDRFKKLRGFSGYLYYQHLEKIDMVRIVDMIHTDKYIADDRNEQFRLYDVIVTNGKLFEEFVSCFAEMSGCPEFRPYRNHKA